MGCGESCLWGQAGGRNCWKAAPTGDVAKHSINPSLGSQPPLSCQARGWGRAHLWVPSSQAQASVMNSSNVRKKSRFPWVGPPSRAVYLHKNESFLSSPEGPLGGQIFAPTLAKGHGGVEAKISQPACKRFEVKSHSLTLGLSHTEPGACLQRETRLSQKQTAWIQVPRRG